MNLHITYASAKLDLKINVFMCQYLDNIISRIHASINILVTVLKGESVIHFRPSSDKGK